MNRFLKKKEGRKEDEGEISKKSRKVVVRKYDSEYLLTTICSKKVFSRCYQSMELYPVFNLKVFILQNPQKI